MNIVFAHDHEFIVDSENKFYSPGKLNNESFERYFHCFSSVTIVSRFKVAKSNIFAGFNEINRPGIDFIPFKNLSNFKNRFLNRRKYKKQLAEILKNHDGLIVRIPSEIGFLIAHTAYEMNIPYVCEVVACPRDAMKGFDTLKSKLYLPIIVNEMEQCLQKSSGALYVTNEFLQRRYPCPGFAVSASNVEISGVFPKSEPVDIENKSIIKIALIGHLDSSHKGYGTLYKAARLLDASCNRKLEFVLVGAGSKFKNDFMGNNVSFKFTGSLTQKQVQELLGEVDLYVQPSNQEGLPRATIEAMSRGLPCVVSSAGGLPEIINKKYVHNVDDFTVMAEKILFLISNSAAYRAASIENIAMAKKFLSAKLMKKRNAFFERYKNTLISHVNAK